MRNLIIIFSLLFTTTILAEEQKAVVKTCGKQTLQGEIIPGKYIDGAFIKIKNGNRHKSANGGKLSFPVPGGKYAIIDVSYTNPSGEKYQLIDIDELGKEHTYSQEEKKIIITTPLELEEDKFSRAKRF